MWPTMVDIDGVFKAYDIRGLFPDQIDAGLANSIGSAFAGWLAAVVRHVLRRDNLENLWQDSNGALLWELIEVQPAAVGVG